MYDRMLVLNSIQNIEKSLNEILAWTSHIISVNDFLTSSDGMILG
jgi:hypothetical protein